ERDHPLFQLLRAGLQVLSADPAEPAVFVDAFLLRAAGLAGFHVEAVGCAICQRPGPHAFLSVKGGGTLCPDHAPTGTRAVAPEVVALLALLVSPGEWAALPAAAAEHPQAYRTAGSYTRAFVEHHLHRQLRSYDLLPRPEHDGPG
ncbi:DNA repair protein RecO, partial [Enterococcus faecalis]|uniref:DNA repair protein RecO n=1 Tax=Enterococcus faecalis TaxID=1351 RepID=UPI001BA45236